MKNKIYATLCLTSLLFIASSCNVNSSYINREEDKKDAEKVADQFYTLLQKKEFHKIDPMLSTQFKTDQCREIKRLPKRSTKQIR